MLNTGGRYLEGFEVFVIGSAYLERGGGGFRRLVGGLQNMLLLLKMVHGRGVICKEL